MGDFAEFVREHWGEEAEHLNPRLVEMVEQAMGSPIVRFVACYPPCGRRLACELWDEFQKTSASEKSSAEGVEKCD